MSDNVFAYSCRILRIMVVDLAKKEHNKWRSSEIIQEVIKEQDDTARVEKRLEISRQINQRRLITYMRRFKRKVFPQLIKFKHQELPYSVEKQTSHLLHLNKLPRVTLSATNIYELTHELPRQRMRTGVALVRWKTSLNINEDAEDVLRPVGLTFRQQETIVKKVKRPSFLKRAKKLLVSLFCGCCSGQ